MIFDLIKEYMAIKQNTEDISDLLQNINKIHTTELGIVRIKRNLTLQTDDVVTWCKREINPSNEIYRKGKNWYVITPECVITINAHSYTIITAHKK
jgi:hypothetical protein